MTITIRLSDDEERRLSDRAEKTGEGVTAYVHRLITRDLQSSDILDRILAPVRQQFEESGMGEEDLAALVEEAREEVWQEKQARRDKPPLSPEAGGPKAIHVKSIEPGSRKNQAS